MVCLIQNVSYVQWQKLCRYRTDKTVAVSDRGILLKKWKVSKLFYVCETIDIIYYYVIWTDNGSRLLEGDTRGARGEIYNDKSIAGLHPEIIFIFSQYSVYLLQDRQYAICNTFNICRLFLFTAMWASIYPPTDALLYQSMLWVGYECYDILMMSLV